MIWVDIPRQVAVHLSIFIQLNFFSNQLDYGR